MLLSGRAGGEHREPSGGRERGANVVDAGYDRDEIVDATLGQMARGTYPRDELYGDGRAGERIADVLASAHLTVEKQLAY